MPFRSTLRENWLGWHIIHFGNKDDLDFRHVLEQLHKVFGLKEVMLEGGGSINGSLLHAGLIDELSVHIFPFEAGSSLSNKASSKLKLVHVEKLDHGMLWLRYQFNPK